MKSKTYLFFTRAQPIHKGHEQILQEMFYDALTHLELNKDKKVNAIVLLGSCDDIDSIRNPLSTEFRSELVKTVCDNIINEYKEKLFKDVENINNFSFNIIELFDSPYNYDLWVENAQRKLFSAVESDTEIVVYGQEGVEQYARDFDGKSCVISTKLVEEQEIHATKVREMIMDSDTEVRKFLPDCISDEQFKKIFDNIQKIMVTAKGYADSTGNKYNSCYMAVDNLVQYGGKILFIRRKDNGKLALPGGFAEPSWTLIQNAKRELNEEASVDIDTIGAILREQKVFDAPFRGPRASNRVNILTTVFHWVLKTKPLTVAGDDAASAEWLRFDEIEDKAPSEFHGDHKKLVCNMLKLNYFCNKVE